MGALGSPPEDASSSVETFTPEDSDEEAPLTGTHGVEPKVKVDRWASALQFCRDALSSSAFVKCAVLVAMCSQNTVYTLLRRYSVGVLHEKYDSQMLLLVAEVLKLFFSACVSVAGMRSKSSSEPDRSVGGHLSATAALEGLWHLVYSSGKMCLLAMIYGAMNILSFVALRRIDAGTFTVLAQLKILTTAGFARAVLQKPLSLAKWRALVLLVLACILVASPQIQGDSKQSNSAGEDVEEDRTRILLGIGAVLLEVLLSGFASIYFEKVVKSTADEFSVWDRNFQLAFHSILIYALYMYVSRFLFGFDDETVANDSLDANASFFYGFTALAWLLAAMGAAGGLLVALTVKVADSILKTLGVSFSIVLATLFSHFLLAGPLDLPMGIGACCAVLAVLNYSFDATPATE